MFGMFLKFGNGIPSVRDIRYRSSADGRRIPPLWVRYERPVSLPPHERPAGRVALNHLTSIRQVKYASGAVYTFGPWVPARRIPRVQGERTPLLRLPGPGLWGIENDKTSRIKEFSLCEALQYSYFRDHRFAILTCLMLSFGLWSMLVPEPLALKPAVLSSVDLGLIVKVAKNAFIEEVCSKHPHILSPCECGEPLNSTLKEFLDPDKEFLYTDKELFDPLGIYHRERRLSALSTYAGAIVLFIALLESVSPNGVYINTDFWS